MTAIRRAIGLVIAAGVLGSACASRQPNALGPGGVAGQAGASGTKPAADGGGRSGSAGHAGAAGRAADQGSAGLAADGGRDMTADDDAGVPAPIESPWGIATSASSSRSLASWAGTIRATGIDWVRGFDTDNAEARLATAAANQLQVSGILLFSSATGAQTFPVDDLPGWTRYITDLVTRCKGRVFDWELWNEPPNFTENKTPEGYAAIVKPGYDAVKAVDPKIRVGLAAQSNHVNWLAQTIAAGAKDHFDYVTVHPYETLGLVDQGFEAEFMAIVPTLRKMLAQTSPAQVNVPIWFTELGEPVQAPITPQHQADTLVKAYTMGIAQGALRVHWFEGVDGDSGPFGLIDGTGNKRLAYTAVTQLIQQLGAAPHYLGFVLLNQRHYGFVFQATHNTVLVTWARPGETANVSFGAPVALVNPSSGSSANVDATMLTSSPVIVVGVPNALLAEAKQNRARPFPWDGDFSQANVVSFAADSGAAGLHPIGAQPSVIVAGQAGRDQSAASSQSFTVDPNFLAYDTRPIEITAVLRRKGVTAAGFNLKYEATSGSKSTGSWYSVPGSDQWYSQSWTIDDDQFVGKWGYNFSFDSDSTTNSQYLLQSVTVTKR
jgi:hypothetical protein